MSASRSEHHTELFDYAPADAGIFTCDLQRNVLYGDSAFATLFGLDPKVVKHGLPLESYLSRIHEDDRPRVARSIFDAIAADLPQQEEYRVKSGPRSYADVVSYGRSFQDGDGNPILFSGIVVPATTTPHSAH